MTLPRPGCSFLAPLRYASVWPAASVAKFCRRSGLREHEVRLILRDVMTVTPALAEKLGRVFYSPGFWLVHIPTQTDH